MLTHKCRLHRWRYCTWQAVAIVVASFLTHPVAVNAQIVSFTGDLFIPAHRYLSDTQFLAWGATLQQLCNVPNPKIITYPPRNGVFWGLMKRSQVVTERVSGRERS
eukprot:5773717-Pyramimonas_sp.AAC.2